MLDVAFKGQGTAVLKKMSITAFESMLLFVEVMLGVEGFQSHCKHLQSIRNQHNWCVDGRQADWPYVVIFDFV